MSQKNILFVCGHNAGRSQMAEAYFNHINTNAQYIAISCGTHPSESINPQVKILLQEEGIKINGLFPKLITEEMEKNAEKIFTMGCGVDCRIFSGNHVVVDLGLSDPNKKSKEEVREIFQELKLCVEKIVQDLL